MPSPRSFPADPSAAVVDRPVPAEVKVRAKPEKLHALTSLRFFAALAVVFYHTLWYAVPSMTRWSRAGRFLSLGNLPVNFFFLLSGYILAVVYLRSAKQVQKKSFFVARFARIYPLFFLMLVVDAPELLMNRIAKYGLASAVAKTAATFVANVFMLQAWFLHLRGIDNPNWSLAVETVFYLLFPFLGVWLWRFQKRQVVLASLAIWIGSQALIYVIAPHLDPDVVAFNPLLQIPTFVLGILLARWQRLQREKHGDKPQFAGSTWVALACAVATFIVVAHWYQVMPPGNLSDGLLVPIFAGVIWAFSRNESVLAKMLSVNWLVILGEASFGLYLIHIPVYQVYKHLNLEHIHALYPVYVATSIGLSVLSFYYFEAPARKWITRKFDTRPRETLEMASDAQ